MDEIEIDMSKIDMDKINELLSPSGLGILVKDDGTFAEMTYPPQFLAQYPPESIEIGWSGTWDMADILDHHERDAIESMEGPWEILTGWGHDGSPFRRRSDHGIGRDLAEHILTTPGIWQCVSVEMYPPHCQDGADGMPCAEYNARERCDHADYPGGSEYAGWALIHQDVTA